MSRPTSRNTKPAFRGVVDLGLRDVGIQNDPRRHGAYFGKSFAQALALAVLSAFGACALVGAVGAAGLVVLAVVLTWTAGIVLLALQITKRAPMVVMRITAEGTNQTTWLAIAPALVVALYALLSRDPLMIPMVASTAILAVLAWRERGRVPEVLRELRPLLAEDEPVLGDGIGMVQGSRSWNGAFRMVVATDRRVLVAASTRSTEPLLPVDVPYSRVSRFGIEFKYGGYLGTLSLTVAGEGGAPAETHVVTSIAPANLVSIAGALQSHGVEADDPAAVSFAERAWEEARLAESERRAQRKRLLDRAEMNTPEFDHGIWLLLGLGALTFYVNPFGVGIGASRNGDLALLFVPFVCGACGYVSRTRSSLAYLVPLNLLAAPAFFFWPPNYVIALMFLLSAGGAAGLWVGWRLRGAKGGRVSEGGPRPAPGSLRHALSGMRLVRITGVMLATVVSLLVTTAAAGFELTSLRLAVDQLTLQQVPADGRSSLTGNAASLRYTPGKGLHEFITDEELDADSDAGARWELRSSFTRGFNVISLATYRPDPPVDDPAGLKEFLARKDREHSGLAGWSVTHAEMTVDGRKGYYWHHDSERGYKYFAAWFPRPVNSVRLECISKNEKRRFERLCGEAVRSLKFSSAAP